MKKLLSLSFTVLLWGCASTSTAPHFVDLSKESQCCESLDDLVFMPLEKQTVNKFSLGNNSKIHAFGEHFSYVQAFELPRLSANDYFFVKSYFNGFFIGEYLDPAFLVLNEDRETISGFTLDMTFDKGNLFGDPNAHMYSYFDLPEEAKYLVVFSGDFQGKSYNTVTEGGTEVTFVGDIPVASASGGSSLELHRAQQGTLKLEIMTLEQ